MKIHIILLTAILFFAGCAKKNQNMPSMNATINNAAFSAIGYRVVSSGPQAGLVTISASNLPAATTDVPTSIIITVPDTANNYTFDEPTGNNQATAFYSSAATNGVLVAATSGQVRVTSCSAHSIQGSFSFIVEGKTVTYAVTNGQFFSTF
jgi:hypothetical protein